LQTTVEFVQSEKKLASLKRDSVTRIMLN
jgi:hypothetical protein